MLVLSLRGDALGSPLVLFAFVCTMKFLLNRTTGTFIALSAFDLLSLHCLFWNGLTILAATSADLVWMNFPRWLRIARTILVIGAALKLPFAMWGYMVQAESNAKTVARNLEQHAGPHDLIVVNPWTYGVTFNWYYRGIAPWVTVPRIEDHRIHL
jgi:hypothetical protein